MSSYPYIVLSARYQAINHKIPTLPNKPKEPELKLVKKNWFEKLILWCDDYDDEDINERRKKRYAQQMEQYYQDMESYRREVNLILSDTNISIFRQKEREKNIGARSIGGELQRDVQKGRYEESFVRFLASIFGDKITNSIEFTLPNGNAYVPDAAYIDRASGLCIDIEIDEPYSLPDGKPIHYIGCDDYRNNYFSQKGWFVVRFAEEQVAKYPEECITFLKEFINNLANGTLPSFTHKTKRWSLAEAFAMANSSYRSNY